MDVCHMSGRWLCKPCLEWLAFLMHMLPDPRRSTIERSDVRRKSCHEGASSIVAQGLLCKSFGKASQIYNDLDCVEHAQGTEMANILATRPGANISLQLPYMSQKGKSCLFQTTQAQRCIGEPPSHAATPSCTSRRAKNPISRLPMAEPSICGRSASSRKDGCPPLHHAVLLSRFITAARTVQSLWIALDSSPLPGSQ